MRDGTLFRFDFLPGELRFHYDLIWYDLICRWTVLTGYRLNSQTAVRKPICLSVAYL